MFKYIRVIEIAKLTLSVAEIKILLFTRHHLGDAGYIYFVSVANVFSTRDVIFNS